MLRGAGAGWCLQLPVLSAGKLEESGAIFKVGLANLVNYLLPLLIRIATEVKATQRQVRLIMPQSFELVQNHWQYLVQG